MIVAYPLKKQSDYTELKYSLRSIALYLQPKEVIIIGEKLPDWINNVTWIKLPDVVSQANLSVRWKTIAALEYSKEIIHMNDDIYLLRRYEPRYYSSGTLHGKSESGSKPLMSRLKELGKPIKYFGHYPAVYRSDFITVMSNFASDCITKSAYLNYLNISSIEVPDCKIISAMKEDMIYKFISDKPCFSSGVHSLKSCLPVLKSLFPNPSIYEI